MKAGDYVVYKKSNEDAVKWGTCTDPRCILKIGDTYRISKVDVQPWHTKIHLCDFTGGFHSVCFEEIE